MALSEATSGPAGTWPMSMDRCSSARSPRETSGTARMRAVRSHTFLRDEKDEGDTGTWGGVWGQHLGEGGGGLVGAVGGGGFVGAVKEGGIGVLGLLRPISRPDSGQAGKAENPVALEKVMKLGLRLIRVRFGRRWSVELIAQANGPHALPG